MTPAKTIFLRMFFIAIVIIAIGSAAYVVILHAEKSRAELPVIKHLPPFEFIDQDGQPFGLDNFKGKISVVDFIFTRCKGPCPVMAGHMEQLYQTFKDEKQVQLVSISVDPEHDSIAVLKQYGVDHGVTDNRWVFLWAPIDSVVKLSEDGFMLAAEDLPGSHTTKWALVDQFGNIRAYYSGTEAASIDILKHDIARLVTQTK